MEEEPQIPEDGSCACDDSSGKIHTHKRNRIMCFTASSVSILCMLYMFISRSYVLKEGNEPHRKLRERRKGASPSSRIVGGSTAENGSYPYMVALYWGTMNGNKPVCGGTLITPNIVVTAAHCVYSVTSLEINRHDVRDDTGVSTYKIKWANKRFHPDYDSNTNNNDIALIKLPSRHRHAVPATLHRAGAVPAVLTAIGWGQLRTGGDQPDALMEVDVKHQRDSTCTARYGNSFNPDTMVCASDEAKDSCQGDSGGPLLAKGTSMLVGITSWGYECASNYYPGVYARVSTYDTWIDYVVCTDLSPSDCINGRIATEFTEPPTPSPTNQPSTHPSVHASQKPSESPSDMPSTSLPSLHPSASPSHDPTSTPTLTHSAGPTVFPSMLPSARPSHHPSSAPTLSHSAGPTVFSSMLPSHTPSESPSAILLTSLPSVLPSASPSHHPSSTPTLTQSAGPTVFSSMLPSTRPTPQTPSASPSAVTVASPASFHPPTSPSHDPSSTPTLNHSAGPTVFPSMLPSTRSSSIPSMLPTEVRSAGPSNNPTASPSLEPSLSSSAPSRSLFILTPSRAIDFLPSGTPTFSSSSSILPTEVVSAVPSSTPTLHHSAGPTVLPSMLPSTKSSSIPSMLPTEVHSAVPSNNPTASPSLEPSRSSSAPSKSLLILTPSRSIEFQNQACYDQDFIVVADEIRSCDWVKQRKNRRCSSYEKFCPETCQMPGC